MTHALRLGKRAFTVSVVVTTIAWSIGLAAFLAPLTAHAAVSAGDLIKASLPAVYYYGSDGKRYVFPNEKTYFTWYSDFSSVKTITDDELAAITIGGNATYKPGVKMVKITTDPKVYAVDAHGTLRWVKSEALAIELYGSNWNQQIHDIPDAFFVNYSVGSDIAAAADFNKSSVTTAATSINSDKSLGEISTVTPVASGALNVALASDTPAANSVLTDSGGTTDGAQAMASFTTLVFTASSAGSVTVNTLKFKRSGISADTDFSNVYLYEGRTRLAESASFDSAYVTLNSAVGLFTVPAGESKKITVKGDLTNTTTSIAGKTFRFSLESSSDVTSNAASVSGSFPAVGNYMTGAQVTDLATFTINTYTTFPATIDPGVTDRELWRFNLVGANWDVNVEYMKLTVVGTIATADLANLKLTVGGIQIGSTVAQLNSAKEAIFDISSSPYKIKAGQTKTVQVMGDVIGGTNRAFEFTIQKMVDVMARDTNYDVYLKPNQADSFTLIEADSGTGDGTNINTGTLTITRHTGSPTGFITRGLTNAVLAKFNFKANGEDIKLTELGVSVDLDTDDNTDLNNGKLYLDGVQVGTTKDLDTDATADGVQASWIDDDAAGDDDTQFTFGNSFIIPAGVTKTLEVRGDIVKGAGTSLTENAVITVKLNAGAESAAEGTTSGTNGQGQTSMSTITSASADGLPLTVGVGTVTVIENSGLADKSSSSPSGVVGGTNVRISSFIVTAGSGEGVDVTQIVLSDYAYPGSVNYQNLKLMYGATQIGLTKGTLNSSSSTYTFSPSPAISIEAGQQYTIDVYADVLTGASNSATAHVPFNLAASAVTATGKVSGLSANGPAAAVTPQLVYLSTGGNLTVIESADTPIAGQLAMGETDVTMAKFRLQADAAEGIRITQLIVSDDMSNTWIEGGTGTLRNLKLYDDSTLLGTVSSLSETNSSSFPYGVFTSLSIEIPKNGSKTLTVKADVTPYDGMSITSTRHRVVMRKHYKYDSASTNIAAVTDNTIIAWGVDSGTQLTGDSLDYNGGSTIHATTDTDAIGSAQDVFKCKLSIAHHSTAPSGTHAAATEDTIAKFVVSNQSPGGFTARVRNLNLDITSSGFSLNSSSLVRVYKSSSYTAANRLISSDFCDADAGGVCGSAEFVDTTFTEAGFTDVDISAGSSKVLYVTMNTTSASLDTTKETLSVGIDSNDVSWDEDAYDSASGNAAGVDLSEISDLPLVGKALSFD